MKYAVRQEITVMQKLNEKYMSDEETDDEDRNTLIRRSPGWRSAALNKLIAKLDCKYLKKKKIAQNQLRKGLMGPCQIEHPQIMLLMGTGVNK